MTISYNFQVGTFTAIDFETADNGRDSACSVGLVRVENLKITRKEHFLIKPPRKHFLFTELHGISWEDVKDSPEFSGVWGGIRGLIDGSDFLAAHNASFDKSVLSACCSAAGLAVPDIPFKCTVKLARNTLKIAPATLSHVCHHLSIKLNHHNALSDAEACAKIMITVLEMEAERSIGQQS